MSGNRGKLPTQDPLTPSMIPSTASTHSGGIKAPPPSVMSNIGVQLDMGVNKKLPDQWKNIHIAKRKATYPYRARVYDERVIMDKTRTAPPPHDYFGFIFSKDSPRPRNITYYTLPYLAQPTRRQKVLLSLPKIPEGVIFPMKSANSGFLPLTTIKVRWAASPRHTGYRLGDIYQIMSQFGTIEKVYGVCPNSALVVFEELQSSKAAVGCNKLGLPWDPLIAQWHEARMNSYSFYRKYEQMDEVCRNATLEGFEKKTKTHKKEEEGSNKK